MCSGSQFISCTSKQAQKNWIDATALRTLLCHTVADTLLGNSHDHSLDGSSLNSVKTTSAPQAGPQAHQVILDPVQLIISTGVNHTRKAMVVRRLDLHKTPAVLHHMCVSMRSTYEQWRKPQEQSEQSHLRCILEGFLHPGRPQPSSH